MLADALVNGRQLLEDLAQDMTPEVGGRLKGIAESLGRYPEDTAIGSFPADFRQELAQNIATTGLLFSMLAGDIKIEKGFADSMGLDVVRQRKMDGQCRKVADEFRAAAEKVKAV